MGIEDELKKIGITFKNGVVIPVLQNLFQKTEDETCPKSFHEATRILIPRPDKDSTNKENYKYPS